MFLKFCFGTAPESIFSLKAIRLDMKMLTS